MIGRTTLKCADGGSGSELLLYLANIQSDAAAHSRQKHTCRHVRNGSNADTASTGRVIFLR
jgi:hypothetical protein